MDLITALAVSIGVLGGIATYVLLSPIGFGLQICSNSHFEKPSRRKRRGELKGEGFEEAVP